MTMSFDEFKNILDKIPGVMKVNIQGMGEPLLAKDFVKMINYAKKKGAIVTTVSNGMALTPEKSEELISSKIDRIYFSIDNADPEKYKKYRVGGDLRIVSGNIKKFIEIKKEKKNNKIFTGIWMLLFNDNIDQLVPVLKLAKRIGVDEVVVQTEISFRGKENWKDVISNMKIDKNSEFYSSIKKAKKEAKKIGIKMSIHEGLGVMKPTFESRCMWPWKSLYITAEGNVSPCCIIADPSVAFMGNIGEEDFDKIWNGDKYLELREKLLENDIPDYCKGCYKKCK